MGSGWDRLSFVSEGVSQDQLAVLTRYRRRWRLFSDMRPADDDSDDLDFEIPSDDTAATDIDSVTRHEHIEEALRKLPDHQRVPLVLFHFEDMSYEDIAAQLNISLAKLKTDMLRGRAALAKVLQRKGIYATLASIIAIFSGAQLFALGIIGEYLGRMHLRTMERPPYIVRTATIAQTALPSRQYERR